MKLFTFLIASAVAINSASGTLYLAKSLVNKNLASADALTKKVLNSASTHETYDIHINRQPVCVDCTGKANNDQTSQSPAVKGRYFYYPSSYVYPPTAYYYYPNSYAVPVPTHQGSHRRLGVYGSESTFNQAYFVYPGQPLAQPTHKNVQVYKPPNVPEHHQLEPLQLAPVPISVYPPFSKIVRQKSGRPVVSPSRLRYPNRSGFKGGSSDPTNTTTTTEATTTTTEDTQQQQQEEEQTSEDPVKGYYY